MPVVGTANISRLADALRQTAHESGITTQQVMITSANQILAEMEALVPVDTGRLRSSLGVQVETDKVIIGPNSDIAPYGGYVEFGTRPHLIRPKNPDGTLSFMVGSTRVFAKVVHHPGTRAQPYVRPAFEAWVDSLGTMAAQANVKVFTDNA